MEVEKKFKIKKKYRKIIFFIAIAIIIFIVVFAIFKIGKFGNKDNNIVDLEGKMTTMVTSFYDKNIKGKVIGVHRQIVTLQDLKDQSYDISDFIKSECSLESFSYVLLDDPNEADVNKIKYTIEHHLDCK